MLLGSLCWLMLLLHQQERHALLAEARLMLLDL